MKSTSNLFNFTLLCVLVVLALGAWRSQAQVSAQALPPSPTIVDASRSVQVSGAAIVYVTPDRALLQLGVQSNGPAPEAVQADNFQKIQRVINAVRALGVDTKDIATDHYIVYPVYESYTALTIKGYQIDNTVSITLRDVSLADDAILAALKAGANEVQDVQFYTSDLRKYRDQARELAVKAAGQKAQSLAGSAGAHVGSVLSISENTSTQYYGSWRGGRDTALWAQNVVQNAGPSQAAPAALDDSPISLGQIAVRVEVNTSYSLR